MFKKLLLLYGTLITAVSATGSFSIKHNDTKTKKDNGQTQKKKPNILLILADDMGYSDIGCYGGFINTPNIDSLAENGVKLTNFTNTARCSPSRASILTGQHPYDSGIYNLPEWDTRVEGGYLNKNVVTIPEVLKEDGYSTFMTGKWHLSKDIGVDVMDHGDSWPLKRGFDKFYGTIPGGGSYFTPESIWDNEEKIDDVVSKDPTFYYTDAISNKACEYIENCVDNSEPFFGYVAYTCPHFPIHAKPEDIAKYKGKFDEGWDILREKKFKQMIEMGLVDPNWGLPEPHPSTNVEKWESKGNKDYLAKCMEVYAAMIDCMDQGIGRILNKLESKNVLDDTMIIFLSDNGASAEGLSGQNYNLDELGTNLSYNSMGAGWAMLSCAPYRMFKKFVHNGGIKTPFIMQWKNNNLGIIPNSTRTSGAQIFDIMPTILEATGAKYPETYNGNSIKKYVGKSIKSIITDDTPIRDTFFWEHEDCMGVQKGDWKLVRVKGWDWELYNIKEDGTECNNIADKYPQLVDSLKQLYINWTLTTANTNKDNLLINGDFERSANYLNKHDGWLTNATKEVDQNAEFVETFDVHNGEWRLTHYSPQDFETNTFQTIYNLTPGFYEISAYVKRDANDSLYDSSYMYVSSGNSYIKANISNDPFYKKYSIIFPTEDSNLTVGFYTKAKANGWVAFDDVFVRLKSRFA